MIIGLRSTTRGEGEERERGSDDEKDILVREKVNTYILF